MRTLSASADADWYQLREKDTLAKCLRVIELAWLANDSHGDGNRFITKMRMSMGIFQLASKLIC